LGRRRIPERKLPSREPPDRNSSAASFHESRERGRTGGSLPIED